MELFEENTWNNTMVVCYTIVFSRNFSWSRDWFLKKAGVIPNCWPIQIRNFSCVILSGKWLCYFPDYCYFLLLPTWPSSRFFSCDFSSFALRPRVQRFPNLLNSSSFDFLKKFGTDFLELSFQKLIHTRRARCGFTSTSV